MTPLPRPVRAAAMRSSTSIQAEVATDAPWISSMRAPAARFVALAIFGCAAAAVVAAPLAGRYGHPRAASAIYALFSTVCHQRAERSFFLASEPFAVCQRCTGIYFGLFLGPLVAGGALARARIRTRRAWVVGATLPLALDAALAWSGIRPGSALTRAATGLLFGSMLATVLVPALSELAAEFAARRDSALGRQRLRAPGRPS